MELTTEDQKAIVQFREVGGAFIKSHHDDYYLLKWIKARSYNVQSAVEMYKQSMEWRRVNKVDRLLEEYTEPEVLTQHFPGGIIAEDMYGRPVWYDDFSKVDIAAVLTEITLDDIMKGMIYRFEKIYQLFREASEKYQRHIDQCVHIINLSDIGWKFFSFRALQCYTRLLSTMDYNYPETLSKTYIIQAPWTFWAGFKMIRPILSQATIDKFVFVSGDMKAVEEMLSEVIQGEELRKTMGHMTNQYEV